MFSTKFLANCYICRYEQFEEDPQAELIVPMFINNILPKKLRFDLETLELLPMELYTCGNSCKSCVARTDSPNAIPTYLNIAPSLPRLKPQKKNLDSFPFLPDQMQRHNFCCFSVTTKIKDKHELAESLIRHVQSCTKDIAVYNSRIAEQISILSFEYTYDKGMPQIESTKRSFSEYAATVKKHNNFLFRSTKIKRWLFDVDHYLLDIYNGKDSVSFLRTGLRERLYHLMLNCETSLRKLVTRRIVQYSKVCETPKIIYLENLH